MLQPQPGFVLDLGSGLDCLHPGCWFEGNKRFLLPYTIIVNNLEGSLVLYQGQLKRQPCTSGQAAELDQLLRHADAGGHLQAVLRCSTMEPLRPHKHKDPTSWWKVPRQRGFQHPCLVGSVRLFGLLAPSLCHAATYVIQGCLVLPLLLHPCVSGRVFRDRA